MKSGDFALYKQNGYLEIVQIKDCDIRSAQVECLLVEALNDLSKDDEYVTFDYLKSRLVLITDEKEISRLNKIMVFK